jgi:hypothetical protein
MGPVSQGDITPVLKATRDAVTDIMRGVLAKVTQFSKNGSAETEHDKKNHDSSSDSNSSSHNSHSNGHNNNDNSSYSGMDNNSSSNSDDVIRQLNKEKNALERRVRLLEEENERSAALAYKMENALSSSSSSVSGDTTLASYPSCSLDLLTNSSFLSLFPS